ncbi:MAG: hypothetical protein JXA57_06990 [Armatimonadetes bacterium]|nr:hypothetical protein [Armatimonadota bacterium]
MARESLPYDLSAIMDSYQKDELRGRPGYHSAMLTRADQNTGGTGPSPRLLAPTKHGSDRITIRLVLTNLEESIFS